MSDKTRNDKQSHETAPRRRPMIRPLEQRLEALREQIDPTMLQRAVARPDAATPPTMRALQRAYGNEAVSGLMQPKLMVGPVGDHYEQEADRVAERVMSMPEPVSVQPGVQRQEEEELPVQGKAAIQRQADEEEDLLQGKAAVQRQVEEEEIEMKPLVQRKTVPEMTPEEELQGKPLVQRQVEEEEMQMAPTHSVQRQADGSFEASASLEQRLTHHRGGGNRLPGKVRGFMEPRFGVDFGGVRVHTDGKAAQMNRELRSQAFTHGEDIYFGAGKYNTGSEAGKRLLAHELTHVVQQDSGAMRRKENGISDGIVQRDVEVALMADPGGPVARALMDADTYGIVFPESVEPTALTATKTGNDWRAVPTDLTGKYSKIVTLAGATEVEGPATDTTEDNYLKQAEDLDDLGAYDGTDWYMEEAVEDHESVHEGRAEPALEDTEDEILDEFEDVSVPDTPAITSAAEATAAIKASPGYATAKADSHLIWVGDMAVKITNDHDVLTPAAEHAVVDPMVESINEWAGEQEPALPAYAP